MTDNRTTELLPCPFCGGEADEYEGDYGNGICCMMCGAMVGEPIHLEYRTTKRVNIAEAIAAWNTRAELGSGTCEMDYIDAYEPASGIEEYLCLCSNCGNQEWWPYNNLPSYCPNCGRKVTA